MKRDKLAQIRERLKQAAPGPWIWDEEFTGRKMIYGGFHCWCDKGDTCLACNPAIDVVHKDVIFIKGGNFLHRDEEEENADLEFVTHAPTDMQELLDEVGRLRGVIESFAHWNRELSDLKGYARSLLDEEDQEEEDQDRFCLIVDSF